MDVNDNRCKSELYQKKVKRRDFLGLTTASMVGIGLSSTFWPLLKSLNPSAEVVAQSTVEVNLKDIELGKTKIVKWQGKPVFVRRRTNEEIESSRSVSMESLKDPEEDSHRVHKGKEEWLVMIGVCTHLGCVPIESHSDNKDGWFCPCHGSYYDITGRILSGPAPKNLQIPDYYFPSKDVLVIGKKGDDLSV